MVLLVLVWWRKRLETSKNGTVDKRWQDAMDDVMWVLRHLHVKMVAVALTTKKRKYIVPKYVIQKN